MANQQNPQQNPQLPRPQQNLNPNPQEQGKPQEPLQGQQQHPQQMVRPALQGENLHGGPNSPLPAVVTAPAAVVDRFAVIDPKTGKPNRKHPKYGLLTRGGMEQVIKNGGSVLHEGRLLTSIAELPTASELAVGHEGLEQSTLDDLKKQREVLDQQIGQLQK